LRADIIRIEALVFFMERNYLACCFNLIKQE
jgi:hypothetical protein